MIRQRKPIKRGKPPRRKSSVRRTNPERRAEAYVKNFSGGIDHDGWIRNRPCCICHRDHGKRSYQLDEDVSLGSVQAAHVKARGMGGANSDWTQLVPLCNHHHREQEKIGVHGILAKYEVDLNEVRKDMVKRHFEEIYVI